MQRDTPHRPDIHIAPPLIFIAGLVVGFALDRLIRPLQLVAGSASPRAMLVVAVTLLMAGAGFALWGVRTFRAARTSVLPFRPATAMVTKGPYRFSRNPMYVGMTLGYLGVAIMLNTAWPVVFLPAVFYGLVKLVISREESYLAAVFGRDYLAYKTRVRRWL